MCVCVCVCVCLCVCLCVCVCVMPENLQNINTATFSFLISQDLLINGEAVSSLSVPENSQDVTLATLAAVDPDANQGHSFTVRGTTLFYTAGDKLEVRTFLYPDFMNKNYDTPAGTCTKQGTAHFNINGK